MSELHEDKVKLLERKANDIRQSIIAMLVEAKSGHTAGPLGMADVFTAFYFHILRHNPQKPDWEERDRLVLSNGHICPVLYATMAHAGYFPLEELQTLRKFSTRLQGHPHREYLPYVETSSGPLGHGPAQAAGMALMNRLNHGISTDRYVYCFMSDGELDEGMVWEAFLIAGKYKLRNLIAVIDRNNIQIDGFTENVMPLEPLRQKFESFGWHVLEVDGHNIQAIVDAVDEAKAVFEKPTVIIAHTIPGKGVSAFERDFKWHGMSPNKEQGVAALAELRTLGGQIMSEHE